MSDKKEQNISLSILLVLILVGIVVFFSIKQKVETPTDKTGDALGAIGDNVEKNMQNETQTAQVAKAGDVVAMNYTGKLTDGTIFDSNVLPEFNHMQPFEFTLGAGQVIRGWDTGIVGMKVGEKKTLTISPEDGYGASGAGNVIPPNATLIFDVELLEIK